MDWFSPALLAASAVAALLAVVLRALCVLERGGCERRAWVRSPALTLMCGRADAADGRRRRMWNPAYLSDVPPCIDAGECGGRITVSADQRMAMQRDGGAGGSHVMLRCGRVRGRMRVEFTVDGELPKTSVVVYAGYALVGASCALGIKSRGVGTCGTGSGDCWTKGEYIGDVQYRAISVGEPAALLIDVEEGTLGYEVNGKFAGTLFRDLKGLAVVPVFFVYGVSSSHPSVTITRVLSGAGERARRSMVLR